MTLKGSLGIIALVFALGVASLGLVLFRMNPYSAKYLSLSLFYISFFMATAGLFILVGFVVRFFARRRDEEFYNPMNVSLRQGILLSLCLTGLLGFQSLHTLSFLDAAILVLIILLIEVYCIAKERTEK